MQIQYTNETRIQTQKGTGYNCQQVLEQHNIAVAKQRVFNSCSKQHIQVSK